MTISQTLEKFITEEIMLAAGRQRLDPQQSLIAGGILDSLALLRLIQFIEEQFDITVNDGDVVSDNFETLAAAETFVKNKLNSRH